MLKREGVKSDEFVDDYQRKLSKWENLNDYVTTDQRNRGVYTDEFADEHPINKVSVET